MGFNSGFNGLNTQKAVATRKSVHSLKKHVVLVCSSSVWAR